MCVCDCEGGDFSEEKAPPSRSLPKRREGREDAGGEAASLREAPLPQTPSPEERLALGLCLSSGLVPPERWEWFPVAWLWSRRLTEPPRPANVWFRHQFISGGRRGGGGDRKAARRALSPASRPQTRNPSRRMVAAALSAAVTSLLPIGDQPHSHGRSTPKEQPSLFPATLREGARGRRFS